MYAEVFTGKMIVILSFLNSTLGTKMKNNRKRVDEPCICK